MIFSLLLAIMLVGLTVSEAPAQASGEALANDLTRNVVRVTARWTNGMQRSGFGFLVGDRGGLLYIVTADHVVRDDNAGVGAPGITFYFDQGKEYQGDILDTHLIKSAGDVAVIRVQPPSNLSWRRDAVANTSGTRGDDVWFVGLQGTWYVPVRAGAISSIQPGGEIRFEGLAIRYGTSGGPLIGKTGILGMIVQDDDVFGTATPIEVITRAFREWAYPWGLTSFSAGTSPAITTTPTPTQSPAPTSTPPPPPTSQQTSTPTPTSTPTSTPPWTSAYSTRDNRDIWQHDIRLADGSIGLHGVDIDECARRCTSNPKCQAFSYDRWNRSCYPKSSLPGSILDPHSMIAVKKPGEVPRVSLKDNSIALLRDKRMHGTPNKTLKARDFEACKMSCNVEILCVAFNFSKRATGDNCEMYKMSDGYEADSKVDAGYKYQAPQ